MSQKIYYAVSVRGGSISRETVTKQIEILNRYGHVLTQHLASNDTNVIDMGKTDREIYQADIKMLQDCDIFVADITAPSLGVGYMIARAETYNKPIACFINGSEFKTSAMIAGCPNIFKYYYDELENTDNSFENNFIRFLVKQTIGHKIFLCGPPGSGKSTIARKLSQEYSMQNISTGAILRNYIATKNDTVSQEIKKYMLNGQLVPADIMRRIIVNALINPETRKTGYVLDGYPPSRNDLDNLKLYGIEPDVVFYFECRDEIAIQRQCGRNERATDNVRDAEARMLVFHAEIPNYSGLCSEWFPNCPVVRISAETSECQMENIIMKTYSNLFRYIDISYEKAYFPIMPYLPENIKSDKFHFHIDTENVEELTLVLRDVYAKCPELHGQIKVYPISHLSLGSQTQYLEIYRHMINFHDIDASDSEAFATGRLGLEADAAVVKRVLSVLAARTGAKYMFEIEQNIAAWELRDGVFYPDTSLDTNTLKFNSDTFSGFNQNLLPNIPPFELHLGFDLGDMSLAHGFRDKPPIDLDKLNRECYMAGLNNGGWFIFKDDRYWKYRSNEFCFENRNNCEEILKRQAILLAKILDGFYFRNHSIQLSLEVVHGIWTFNNN